MNLKDLYLKFIVWEVFTVKDLKWFFLTKGKLRQFMI
jgi:hypothetical protein